MFKLRQKQWDILLHEIETSSTGANIHENRRAYAKAKDETEYFCSCLNDKDGYDKKIGFKYIKNALKFLRKYNYTDYVDFITN